jgi:hypothetical protein
MNLATLPLRVASMLTRSEVRPEGSVMRST